MNVPSVPINTVTQDISALQADVTALEGDVTTLQTTVSTLDTDVDTLASDVSTLDTDVSTLQSDVSALDTALDIVKYGSADGATLVSDIANAKTNRTLVEVPEGLVTVTSTIPIINGDGGKIAGRAAAHPLVEQSNALMNTNSAIRYDGSKGSSEALIEYQRINTKIYDVTLLGKTATQVTAGTGTRTPVGIRVKRATGSYLGIGTGKLYLDNVVFGGFDTCIEWAQSNLDANCDESSLYNVQALHNGTFMKVNNVQGLTYFVYAHRFTSIDTAFDFNAGGKLHVFGGWLGACNTYLKFNGNSNQFGHNNCQYHINGLELDAIARNCKLLDMATGAYYGNITFNNPWFQINTPDVWTNYCFRPADSVHLTIRDAVNLQAGMISWNCSAAGSTIYIDNPLVWTNVSAVTDLFDLASARGTVRIIAKNVRQYNTHTLLGDYNALVTGLA